MLNSQEHLVLADNPLNFTPLICILTHLALFVAFAKKLHSECIALACLLAPDFGQAWLDLSPDALDSA